MLFQIFLFKIDKYTAEIRILKTMEPFQGETGFCKCKNNASVPSSFWNIHALLLEGKNQMNENSSAVFMVPSRMASVV